MKSRAAPSDGEVRGWLDSLSNWGRWGATDQRGTLNYIDGNAVRAACALVTDGVAVSCALPITYERKNIESLSADARVAAAWSTPKHFVFRGGEASAVGSMRRSETYDAFLLAPHGERMTHIDAPSHTLFNGTMYNGRPADAVDRDEGARLGGVEVVADGITGRGILLDMPRAVGRDWLDDGEAIYPEDLEACEAQARVRIQQGDILFVRTGYRKRNPLGAHDAPRPGLQAACLPWLHDRRISVIASDVPIDVRPHTYTFGLPIHTVGMWAMGLWLIDNCFLERLSTTCSSLQRWAFLSVVAPLVLTRGTGSPVNPIAFF